MRKLFTFCTALLVAVGLFAYNPGEVITLDLANPTKPTSFTFNEKNYWTETYNDSDFIYWESQVFGLSHIVDGNSWGGTYYDGFTVSKNAVHLDKPIGWQINGVAWQEAESLPKMKRTKLR